MVDFTYTLDDNERATVIATAEARHKTNRKRGTKDNKIDKKRDPMQVDREGMAGEVVFGALANMFVDLRVDQGAVKADFFARDGSSIDIKTTRHPNGKLLVPLHKALDPCDWYGLVICDWPDPETCPTGRLIGGAHRLLALDRKSVINLGYGPTYGLDQSALIPPADFLSLVAGRI